ncbi:shikimate kinase [Novosphingobium sp.]|uniref:shikimate kinase n=1 Tax=Novosphingobium sp. TaxID=1874826 RepID=UPI0025E74E9F|nr:shikimate kinase [Novosphingobium sp.]
MELDTPTLTAAEIGRIARRIDRPVVLVGMMGTGKSTVGRKLANMLGLPFVDADDEIERAAQMTIPEIFDTYGEPYFRDGERRVIARLLGRSTTMIPQIHPGLGGKIVATGGGAFCDAATRALILDAGIAVWLDSDVDTLVERVGRKGNRPLLRNGNPREILARLREDRAPAYAHAPLHVTSAQAPHLHTALSILKAIDAWL